MRKLFLPLALLAVLCACSNNSATSTAQSKLHVSSVANGRMIFLTGKDVDGFQVLAARPPLHTSCAACHKANGSGVIHLPGGAVSADLRHNALVVQQKLPYTLTSLERAISTGVDNLGQPLNPVMPHWRMTQRDLHDVATYVLTLK